MIHVAVCDDNNLELKQIKKMVHGFMAANPVYDIDLAAFSSSEELLKQLSTRSFDIYLLDIMMEGKNGIEIGRLIRETNDKVPIIYLTSSPDYAVDSYTVGAFYYLIKPFDEAKFLPVLTRAVKRVCTNHDMSIQVRTRFGEVDLPFRQILYLEYHNHLVTYHLRGGRHIDSITIRVSFDEEVRPLLQIEDSPFAKISSSFVVNLTHVTDLFKNGFIMSDGTRLNITRACLEARRQYLELMIKEVAGDDV